MSEKKVIQQGIIGCLVAGLAAGSLPAIASAATATANTTINATVESTISMSSSGTVTLNITPVSGGAQTSASDTVTVSTNNATGYKLTLKDADTTLTLANGLNTIAASSNTMSGATTLANNTWGFAVASATPGVASNTFDASYTVFSNQASHASKWAGITSSDQQIKSTTSTASSDTTTVWYSAKADTTKPSGTYSDIVVYTATTNP